MVQSQNRIRTVRPMRPMVVEKSPLITECYYNLSSAQLEMNRVSSIGFSMQINLCYLLSALGSFFVLFFYYKLFHAP